MIGIIAGFIAVLQGAEGGDVVVESFLGFLEGGKERSFPSSVGGTSGGEEGLS